jgi:hypothetical protein
VGGGGGLRLRVGCRARRSGRWLTEEEESLLVTLCVTAVTLWPYALIAAS